MKRNIYIVLSQTGTVFSRALKFVTGAKYNHVSISLSPTLEKMYSFGRLNPYNPFIGGFVEEGKHKGTFQRFKNTEVMVLELTVDEEKYAGIQSLINYFIQKKTKFHYNYWGIVLACFKKNFAPSNRFYCSQFVRAVLAWLDIENACELPDIVRPIDFLKLTNKKIVYSGLLQKCDIK